MARPLAASLAVLALALGGVHGLAAQRGFEVLHYDAQLDPDVGAGRLAGRERIVLRAAADVADVAFDAGDLQVEAVQVDGVPASFARSGQRLQVRLPAHAARAEQVLDIRYRGAPKFGLQFVPELEQAYTVFSTSQWMVVLDDPSVRATLDLSVVVPAGWAAAGHGVATRTRLDDGRERVAWRQAVPVPSFTYGFAVGRFQETQQVRDGVALRSLSTRRSPDELRAIFRRTGDVLDFMGQVAGIPYRGRYEQALVAQTVGQEAAGFALLSEGFGERVLRGEGSDALIAHEAAHQWWGVLVTCADWGHFWLNEGFAVFMAAAFEERQSGRDAYVQQVAAWQARVERLRAEGHDHPLVYAEWTRPTSDDRAVVYQKGAYVLHLLRETVGEEAFWRGIRDYTRAHQGASVTTADLQRAMERAAGRDLAPFFDRWAWGSLRQSGP